MPRHSAKCSSLLIGATITGKSILVPQTSVEVSTFRAMLDAAASRRERKIMLAAKVEDMLNTVVRQIAFHRFETRFHDERAAGAQAIAVLLAGRPRHQRLALEEAERRLTIALEQGGHVDRRGAS